MILSGIPDPLRQLPDMHALLDVAEVLITEHMTAEQLSQYYRDTYPPARGDWARPGAVGDDGEVLTPPPGFDAEDEMAAFDAFSKMAGG